MVRSDLAFLAGLLSLGALTAFTTSGSSLESPAAWAIGDTSQRTATGATASRIVSATLATDEVLLEILPAERLAAVSHLIDNPTLTNAAELAAAVDGRVRGEAEGMLLHEPDLVFVARFTNPEAVALIEGSGVPVMRLPAYDSLAEINALVRWIGAVVGEPERAAALADQMQQTLHAVEAATRDLERPRVLFYEAGGYTAGRGTVVHELIRIGGGANAADDLGLAGYSKLPLEAALELDPDVILLSDFNEERTRNIGTRRLMSDPVWAQVKAVRDERVHTLRAKWLISIDHNVALAAREIASVLHPSLDLGAGQ